MKIGLRHRITMTPSSEFIAFTVLPQHETSHGLAMPISLFTRVIILRTWVDMASRIISLLYVGHWLALDRSVIR
jgi:hypothetical protein